MKKKLLKLEWLLFFLSLIIYAFTRLYQLDKFPIYFFTDEAIHPVRGYYLFTHNFRDETGNLLPAYFQNGTYWNLSLSVYIHGLTSFLFGKSIFVTRATSAILTVAGAAALALILKIILKQKLWWTAVFFLGVTPAWSLHSRTAFETVIMSSFYVFVILFYLLYRNRSSYFLFPTLIFTAACFYSYANGQVVIAVLGIMLLVSDIKYHLENWRTGLIGIIILILLALPYIRFQMDHETAIRTQLRTLDSYLFRNITLKEKIMRYSQNYIYGLSPQYWFFPNDHDLTRHRMKDLGNIDTRTLPFYMLGILICLWNFRKSPYRIILFGLLAVPAGASLVDIGITRTLAFIIPANIFITLGFITTFEFIKKTLFPNSEFRILNSFVLFFTLSALPFILLYYSLKSGPTWYSDYGLYGMQYGTKQLFAETVPALLSKYPVSKIEISPTWANGTDIFPRFFLSSNQQKHVELNSIDFYLSEKRVIDANTFLILPPNEFEKAKKSYKFKSIKIIDTIPYPDKKPGFYIIQFEYADDIDEILAKEKEERRKPVVENIQLEGENVTVSHSRLDMGTITNIFDNDKFTLARGMEANPFMLEITYPNPHPFKKMVADFGAMDDFTVSIILYDKSKNPTQYYNTYKDVPPEPHIEISFDKGPELISKVKVEIKNNLAGEKANIHIRKLHFL